jgi:hypothetical protein
MAIVNNGYSFQRRTQGWRNTRYKLALLGEFLEDAFQEKSLEFAWE